MHETLIIGGGDRTLVNSPEVITPTQSGGLQQPRFTDHRGTIERVELEGVKVNILYTKAGVMRSGDFHPHPQLDILLSGKVELRTLQNGVHETREVGPNTLIVLEPYVPHLFNFLEPTVMMEWWDGPFECHYYKPYRDIIDAAAKGSP